MIERPMPLSEVMRRLHELDQIERGIRRDRDDRIFGGVCVMLVLAMLSFSLAIIKTKAEQNEARRPAIVQQVTR